MAGTSEVLVTVGATAILAAVAGGGLEALGVKIPVVGSLRRQVVLAVVGATFIWVGLTYGNNDQKLINDEKSPSVEATEMPTSDVVTVDKPPSPASQPAPTPKVTRFDKPSGYFMAQGGRWVEYPEHSVGQNFEFVEFRRDKDFVFLKSIDRDKYGATGNEEDKNNAFLVRLPLAGGTAQWSFENPVSWTDMTEVVPNTSQD